MKLREWLSQLNGYKIGCRIWIDGEDQPAYEGSLYEIPWVLTEMELDDEMCGGPILYTDILTGTEDNEYRNCAGFIIYLK